jgi:hypothetical protein
VRVLDAGGNRSRTSVANSPVRVAVLMAPADTCVQFD